MAPDGDVRLVLCNWHRLHFLSRRYRARTNTMHANWLRLDTSVGPRQLVHSVQTPDRPLEKRGSAGDPRPCEGLTCQSVCQNLVCMTGVWVDPNQAGTYNRRVQVCRSIDTGVSSMYAWWVEITVKPVACFPSSVYSHIYVYITDMYIVIFCE